MRRVVNVLNTQSKIWLPAIMIISINLPLCRLRKKKSTQNLSYGGLVNKEYPRTRVAFEIVQDPNSFNISSLYMNKLFDYPLIRNRVAFDHGTY